MDTPNIHIINHSAITQVYGRDSECLLAVTYVDAVDYLRSSGAKELPEINPKIDGSTYFVRRADEDAGSEVIYYDLRRFVALAKMGNLTLPAYFGKLLSHKDITDIDVDAPGIALLALNPDDEDDTSYNYAIVESAEPGCVIREMLWLIQEYDFAPELLKWWPTAIGKKHRVRGNNFHRPCGCIKRDVITGFYARNNLSIITTFERIVSESSEGIRRRPRSAKESQPTKPTKRPASPSKESRAAKKSRLAKPTKRHRAVVPVEVSDGDTDVASDEGYESTDLVTPGHDNAKLLQESAAMIEHLLAVIRRK